MDLQLYLRVLSRFRLLVVAGLIVAFALAFFAVVRVNFGDGSPKLSYREQDQWASTATLLVTQRSFPYGETASEGASASARFVELAVVYAGLAPTDPVRRIMLREGPFEGVVQASPMTSPLNSDLVLPLISVSVTSTTPRRAVEFTDRASQALREYITEEQRASGIPPDRRIILQEVKRAAEVQHVSGQSKTVPAVVFVTVMLAVLGLVFVLENLRPRVRLVSEESTAPAAPRSSRRPA